MKPIPLPSAARSVLATLLLVPELAAQEDRVRVPPGREIEEHKVLTVGLTDTWEVDVVEGEFLHCVVESGAFDPVLDLVDAAGELQARDDGKGTRSELRHLCGGVGRMSFRVTGYAGRGGGRYRFRLLRYRTERLAVGVVGEHVFGREGWWHFRVPVREGDVLVPRVLAGGRLTAVLDLGQARLPEWHGGYTAQCEGEALLRVEGAEEDRCEVVVRLARRFPLPPGGALDGELAEGGMHVVRHRFTPGAWAFELDEPEHDLAVDFREVQPGSRPRSGWLGHLNKNGRRRQWLFVHEAMDAELVLRNHGGPASYRGRFVPAGEPLSMGGAVEGVLPLGGGRVFTFDPEPGDLVRVELASEAFDGRFDLWTPDGGVQRFDDGRRLDPDPQHTFLVTQRGGHRVLVYTAAGAGSGPFTLCVDPLPIPVLEAGGALTISVDEGDRFAHLTLAAGQEVWLSLRSSDFDGALTVHDPDGRHLGTFEGGGTGGNVLTGLRAEKAGTYTLQVHGRKGGGSGSLRAISP